MTFLLVIGLVGYLSFKAIDRSTRKNLASKLTTILETDIKALTIWTGEQKRSASYLAKRAELRAAIEDLKQDNNDEAARKIDRIYRDAARTFDYIAFEIIDTRGQFLAGSDGDKSLSASTSRFDSYLERLAGGETLFIKPSRQFSQFDRPHDAPLLWVATPVRDRDGNVFASIVLGISPEGQFTEILSVARAGESGETFAFDDKGWLLSDSRFDEELVRMGLLRMDSTPRSRASAVLNIQSKTADEKLTRLVAFAIQSKGDSRHDTMVDLSGSLDYRGVKVVGASRWLPQYDFGVVTKLDYVEAYAPGILLRNIVAILLALSLAVFSANVFFARRVAGLQSRALRAESQVRQLGQYTLLDKIGEGGMGEVYRARHAMLRRPTAVKLLRPDRSSEASIKLFEQEVQMTAMLTHPNTIAIYDYGRTPDETFYYAMEYLDGLDLSRVMKNGGPHPAGRVIMILDQVCQSLREAHEAGLIHRDIKPGNVILLRQGSRADIVKVLDFGLVRDVNVAESRSAERTVVGTPAYMSPESFLTPELVDARSDIYAVGAIGYFLLTGTNAVKIDRSKLHDQWINDAPPVETPSQRLGRTVDSELSNILMRCLSADPAARPQTAAELSMMLRGCRASSHWSDQDSIQWWEQLEASRNASKLDDKIVRAGPTDETLDC